MSSSVYSCQLQSVSESSANAKAGPSNNSNFKTLLDRKFSSLNTQLQQLNQDINDLKNVQLRSSSAGTSFSSTKPQNNKIFSRPNNFAPMRSRTFSFPKYSSNFRPDSAFRNDAKDIVKLSPFCFYHQRFGQDAHQCVQPCSWQGN